MVRVSQYLKSKLHTIYIIVQKLVSIHIISVQSIPYLNISRAFFNQFLLTIETVDAQGQVHFFVQHHVYFYSLFLHRVHISVIYQVDYK